MKKFSRNSLILALLFYSATPAYGWSMPSFLNGFKEKTYVIGALTVTSMAIIGATLWSFLKCGKAKPVKKDAGAAVKPKSQQFCILDWHLNVLKIKNQEERQKYLKDFAEQFGSDLHDKLLDRERQEKSQDTADRLSSCNQPNEAKGAQEEKKVNSGAIDKGRSERVKKAATYLKTLNEEQRQYYLKRLTETFGEEFRAQVLLIASGLD